jgi:hypothetical protein
MRTTQLAQQLRSARVGCIRSGAFYGRRNLTHWNPPNFENEKLVRSPIRRLTLQESSNGYSSTTLRALLSENN